MSNAVNVFIGISCGTISSIIASIIVICFVSRHRFKLYKVHNAQINEKFCKEIASKLRHIMVFDLEVTQIKDRWNVETKEERHRYVEQFCNMCEQDDFKEAFWKNLHDCKANNENKNVLSTLRDINKFFHENKGMIFPKIESKLSDKLDAYERCWLYIKRCVSDKCDKDKAVANICEISKCIKDISDCFEKGNTFENI